MIVINIKRDADAFIYEFVIDGHSGYDKKGRDIICSAVSAVAYTAIGGLQELAGVGDYSECNGFMKCRIPIPVNEKKECVVRTILDTMYIGFKQIENSYSEFIKVIDEEV